MVSLKKIAQATMAACLAVALSGILAGCSSSEEYKPELKSPTIGTPAIGEEGTLRVGVNTNNSPLAGKSGDKIIGIDVDIAAALADELGLALEVVDVGSDGAKAIEDDDVDIVLGIDNNSKQDGFWYSNQYLPTGVVLFELASSKQPAPVSGSDVDIAAQVSSKSAWAVANIFGEDALVSTNDLSNAFTQLNNGDVNYVASDAIIGLYAASRQAVDVKICALLDTAGGYCAMAAQDNTALHTAINDGLTQINSDGVIDVIEKKWLGQSISLATISKIEPRTVTQSNTNKSQDADEDEESDSSADDEDEDSSSSSSSNASGNGGSSSRNAAANNSSRNS